MVEIKSPAPDTANFFDWLQFVEFVMGFRPLFDIVNGLAGRQNIATDRFRHIEQYSITVHERDLRKNNPHLSAAFEILRMRMVLVNPIPHGEPIEA